MQTRIFMNACLAILWFVLVIVILLRVPERWLGQVEDWKRYFAMSLAVIMGLWRSVQLYRLLQLKKRREITDGPSF